MNLLMPVFLSAAALVGLPFLLHLLRLQPRKRVPFPSLQFLGRDALRDSNRQRLRRWLTFLLRCLLILLIVAAFCRPFWPLEHSGKNRAVVVVVDNSYSMQATGRRAAVEAWLAPQLAALRRPDELGVLRLHPTPEWLVPLSDNLAAGREALQTLPQGNETSHYRAGLELAAAKLALSSATEKQILVAGDGQRSGWSGVRFDRPLPPGIKLFSAPIAEPPKRQAAITALKVTRTADGRLACDATVRGFTPANDERTVTFYLAGERLGAQRCVLAGARPQTVHAEFAVADLAPALTVHATIDADDLPLDDTAYAALAAMDDRSVILAAPAAANATSVDFLARALVAVQGRGLAAFRVDPLPAGPAWPPSTVALLRGAAPFSGTAAAALDAFVSAGGSAWIVCDGSPAQNAWLASHGVTVTAARAAAGEKLKLRDLLLEHPLFAPFAGHSIAPLLTPVFHRGWALEGPALEPLARWLDRTVAIAEVSTGAGRLLITGFGETRADSSFPIEAGYVPFVHQAVTWLAQNQLTTPQGCRVGATLALPGAGRWRALLAPVPVPPLAVDGFVTPDVPGIYVFEQDATKRFYAVNLDPIESDLTPWPTAADFAKLINADPGAKITASKTGPTPDQPIADPQFVDERQVWWWLLVAAAVVLFLELALANRTIP